MESELTTLSLITEGLTITDRWQCVRCGKEIARGDPGHMRRVWGEKEKKLCPKCKRLIVSLETYLKTPKEQQNGV